jgi:organic radical activating enzyme
MTLLTQKLKENNRKVHIETSGAYPLTGTWDWICLFLSTKPFMIMHMS